MGQIEVNDHGSRTVCDAVVRYRLPCGDRLPRAHLSARRPRPMTLWQVVRNSDLGDDLIAAGMPATDRAVLDWARAAPYLPAVRNTGFYRSLALAFQDLFDFQAGELTAANWPALSERIQ